jgi:hypothetical protein
MIDFGVNESRIFMKHAIFYSLPMVKIESGRRNAGAGGERERARKRREVVCVAEEIAACTIVPFPPCK